MAWIYHAAYAHAVQGFPYAPSSLGEEGFIHASYLETVRESALLYFPVGSDLVVLEIDPALLDCPVHIANTPRGPMPHIHGPIPQKAVRALLRLEELPATTTGTTTGATTGTTTGK